MTNATLEVVEFAAWHLAAEPSPERMEALLDVVKEYGSGAAETPRVPAQRARRVSPVPAPEPAEAAPERHLEPVSDVPPAAAPEPAPEPYDGPLKVCGRCSREYPATPEFFTRDRTRPDHLRYRCKSCEREVAKPRPKRDRTKVATAKD